MSTIVDSLVSGDWHICLLHVLHYNKIETNQVKETHAIFRTAIWNEALLLYVLKSQLKVKIPITYWMLAPIIYYIKSTACI